MSESSSSSGAKRRERSRSQDKHQTNKLFITNLDGKADLKDVEDELKRMFEKHGVIENLVAKRNRNSDYCFAFAEMKEHSAAVECVKNYDQTLLSGKQIKVEFQDDTKRRKDSNKGCYNCGKMGHFARECHSARNDEGGSRGGYRRRSRSRSRSEDSERPKKNKRRHRSDSSDRGRSRSPKSKKQRKNRSKDRDQKRKKKHKRSNSSS